MLRKWILIVAAASAAGCATLSEPEYPRLGATQAPAATHSSVPGTQSAAQHNVNVRSPKRANPDTPDVEASPASSISEYDLADLFYDHYKEWRGTRYRLGGLSKDGIDCSGFVYVTFVDRLGIELPRSTYYQVKRGKGVLRNDLQTGDLVFFHTGASNHVGIYLEDGKFMHSSNKSGVRISSLYNAYWKRTYWTARRLPLPDSHRLAQLP